MADLRKRYEAQAGPMADENGVWLFSILYSDLRR